jgi:hypothetical protein
MGDVRQMSRTRRVRKWVALGILLLGPPLLLGFMYGPRCVSSDVPCFETPGWVGYGFTDLYGKASGPDGQDLLLTRVMWDEADQKPAIYRYSSKESTLSETTREEWDNAPTDAWKRIAEVASLGSSEDRPRLHRDGRFLYRGSPVETGGRSYIRHHVRPDGRLFAVLSANGWRRPHIKGFMPFLGGGWGGGYAGQHYVDLYRFPSMERVGKPLRIPLTTAEGLSFESWSHDGAYLFFGRSRHQVLCIIPTGAGEQKESSDE